MEKENKYGCSPREDVCLKHSSPLISFGFCEDSPDIKAFILSERTALLERLEKEIEERYGKDGGAALVIVESHDGGVTQRPALSDIRSLIQSERENI